MKPQDTACVTASSAARVSSWAGLGVMGVGAVVLLGWGLDIGVLKGVVPGWAQMKPNAALAFVLSGGALWLMLGKDSSPGKRIVARVGAAVVVGIGALTLFEYLSGMRVGIDELLFRNAPKQNPLFPGRMAPASALNFVILGTALLLLNQRRTQLVLALALAAGLTAFLALAGYLYGAAFLYGVGNTEEMAVHTSLTFLLLSAGIATACVNERVRAMIRKNSAAGVLVRRLLPAAFLVPMVLGWLRLLGQHRGFYETEFGTALLVVASVFIFVAFIWWSARTIIRLDAGRERAEVAIRESERRFRGLLESAPDAMVIANPQGNIVLVNAQTERLFGYTRAELLGQPVEILVPEKLRGRHLWHREEYTGQPQARPMGVGLELFGQRKDGSEFPIEISLSPIQAEEGTLISSAIRDITERKRSESVLKHERYLLHSLMDNVPDRIYFKDREGRFLRNNRAHLARFGLSDPADAVGKTDFDFFPKEHAERAREDERKVMESGRLLEAEERVEWPDGRVEWTLVTKMPLRDAKGEIVGTFGLSHDITNRKLGEETLKRTLAELERSNGELEQFAYVASHDLQEPLRAVTGCLQLLQKAVGNKLGSDENELIVHAVDGAARMRTLIGDLLAFSRVGTRGKPFEATDFNAALDLALANLVVALTESNARVTRDPLPTLPADPGQVAQLFQNLIGNAVKFHGERSPEIHVGARLQDGNWLFSVRDNGIGIEPQYRDRIFVIFQRLHTRTEYAGTGVGLAICKRIVERHGGNIWVESEPGQGSTFYFTIPEKQDNAS